MLAVFILDCLFLAGWLSAFMVVIWLVASLGWALATIQIAQMNLEGAYEQAFVGSVALWISLSGLAFLDWYQRTSEDAERSTLWIRILLANFLLIGPTAYYVGVMRPRFLKVARSNTLPILRKLRVVLDGLSFLAFWGWFAFMVSGIAALLFAGSMGTRLLAIPMFVLLPLSFFSTALLMTVLFINAMERSDATPEEVRGMRLWSVFWIRKYYREFLRPMLL